MKTRRSSSSFKTLLDITNELPDIRLTISVDKTKAAIETETENII